MRSIRTGVSETDSRKDLLGEVGRVVVKIGSSSIMRSQTSISRDFMDSVAEQVARLREMGIEEGDTVSIGDVEFDFVE